MTTDTAFFSVFPSDSDEEEWTDLESAIERTGLDAGLLAAAAREGFVILREERSVRVVRLDTGTLYVLRQVYELHHVRGMDWSAVCLVLRLQARVEALERELRSRRDDLN